MHISPNRTARILPRNVGYKAILKEGFHEESDARFTENANKKPEVKIMVEDWWFG